MTGKYDYLNGLTVEQIAGNFKCEDCGEIIPITERNCEICPYCIEEYELMYMDDERARWEYEEEMKERHEMGYDEYREEPEWYE